MSIPRLSRPRDCHPHDLQLVHRGHGLRARLTHPRHMMELRPWHSSSHCSPCQHPHVQSRIKIRASHVSPAAGLTTDPGHRESAADHPDAALRIRANICQCSRLAFCLCLSGCRNSATAGSHGRLQRLQRLQRLPRMPILTRHSPGPVRGQYDATECISTLAYQSDDATRHRTTCTVFIRDPLWRPAWGLV